MKTRPYLVWILLIVSTVFASCKKEQINNLQPLTGKNKAVAVNPVTNLITNQTTINFSGYTWQVKDSGSGTAGPWANYWSSSNVFVDANGYLHLKLTKDLSNNTWKCSEVIMLDTLGYGTYQWKVVGRIDTLDHNIVFGLFNYSGVNLHDEMDIEFSRWGYPNNANNLNYTVWPAVGVTTPKNVEYLQNFTLTGDWTTHRFTRTANSIVFKSLHGHQDGNTNLFATKTWNAPATSISTVPMPVRMNLWLFKTVPPSNGQNVEIIIREFKYIPL